VNHVAAWPQVRVQCWTYASQTNSPIGIALASCTITYRATDAHDCHTFRRASCVSTWEDVNSDDMVISLLALGVTGLMPSAVSAAEGIFICRSLQNTHIRWTKALGTRPILHFFLGCQGGDRRSSGTGRVGLSGRTGQSGQSARPDHSARTDRSALTCGNTSMTKEGSENK